MENFDGLIEHPRTLFADLSHLQLMNGPEMLLAGWQQFGPGAQCAGGLPVF